MYFYISFQSVLFKNNKKEEKILFIVLCGQNAKSNMALREDPLLTLGTLFFQFLIKSSIKRKKTLSLIRSCAYAVFYSPM